MADGIRLPGSDGGVDSTEIRSAHDDPSYCEGGFDFGELYRRLTVDESGPPSGNGAYEVPAPTLTRGDVSQVDIIDDIPGPPPRKRVKASSMDFSVSSWDKFVAIDNDKFLGGGGFGDVFEGAWRRYSFPNNISSVDPLPRIVVKRMRVRMFDTKAAIKVLREIYVWHHLHHPNIVPFVGISHNGRDPPSIISEWMCNGTIKTYLLNTTMVCLMFVIRGVSLGLKYLHEFDPTIIHGDIKADNILVNRLGVPCICDFGLSRMLVENTLWNTSATQASGTLRWQSPELITADEPTATMSSDMYSYAMTSYELWSQKLPFDHIKNEHKLINEICRQDVNFERPRDPLVPDKLWDLWHQCWSHEPNNRPNVASAVQMLGETCCDGTSSEMCIYNRSEMARNNHGINEESKSKIESPSWSLKNLDRNEGNPDVKDLEDSPDMLNVCPISPSDEFEANEDIAQDRIASSVVRRPCLVILGYGDLETIRKLPETLKDLDALVRYWLKPNPEDFLTYRMPVEYAPRRVARTISGPYIELSSENDFQIATEGMTSTRIEILSSTQAP